MFIENAVNRLWWLLMGRGLIHPLDLRHSGNSPSHPELLALLADEFVAHQFDIRWLLREIALTSAYQRTSLLPEEGEAPRPETYCVALERPLSPEQLLRSMLVATGEAERVAQGTDGLPSLADLTERFNKALANPPKEPEIEFAPSVKGALFLSNDEIVLKLLQPRAGNLIDRLANLADDAVADELYLAVLARSPDETERAETVAYLQKNTQRKTTALSHLAWALLTSAEFCLNH
jgi:hypothetical protein